MYLSWKEKTITDFSPENIEALYNDGFLFTRVDKGVMKQTRSVRIDLEQFELSSENRRVLRKTEMLKLVAAPLPYARYDWTIGKLGKDFYDTKFGYKTFSANKIKELMADAQKSNFNLLLEYFLVMPGQANNPLFFEDRINFQKSFGGEAPENSRPRPLGYCVSFSTQNILHYCYPFYDLEKSPKDMGLGMMTRAVVWAKEQGKKYIYLGSAQRPNDTYKFQFSGIEWWDGKKWETDIEQIKKLLIY